MTYIVEHDHAPSDATASPVRPESASLRGKRHHYIAPGVNGAKKLLAGQDAFRVAKHALAVQRKKRTVPLWVRALEAWVESQYPIGRHGYSEARAVVEQVILHYKQERKLTTGQPRDGVCRDGLHSWDAAADARCTRCGMHGR